MRKTPEPRVAVFYGRSCLPSYRKDGTWLEAEEFCYPSGGMVRRCRARDRMTGRLVVVRCGISDTFFSIPVRGGGFITSDDDGFAFNPPKDKVTP